MGNTNMSDMSDMSSTSPRTCRSTFTPYKPLKEGENRVYSEEEMTVVEENQRIIAKRQAYLLNKEIQGTLICTVRASGKRTFWIRFNKRATDKVLVRKRVVVEAFGTDCPEEGSQVKCIVTALGPKFDLAEEGSAYAMHPQTRKIEIVTHGYPIPPNPNKRRELTRPGMSTFRQRPQRPRFINSKVRKEDQGNCTFGLKPTVHRVPFMSRLRMACAENAPISKSVSLKTSRESSPDFDGEL